MIFRYFLILVIARGTLQTSTPTSPTYEAGVVELFVGSRAGKTYEEWMIDQTTEYMKIMEAAPKTLDIIVFPEGTLNNILTPFEIPEPRDRIVPCNDASYDDKNIVKQFSCAAKKYKRYTVINLTTKVLCPDEEMIANNDPRDCSARPDGYSYYNTNIVFDRNGTLISRYRKFHLFGEVVDRPYKPSMQYFDTDFGVRFGHFICFDINYRYPALELVRNYNLSDIVYPTMWFSELPYSTAVQVQQNWAHSQNVNLLASGANYVPVGSTGTGIYGGKKGAYVSDMAGVTKIALHTATVYKIKGFPQNDNKVIEHKVVKYTTEEMQGVFLYSDPLENFNIFFLNEIDGFHSYERRNCLNGMCCNIRVHYTVANAARNEHYQYALAFYHGKRTFQGQGDGGVFACSILACPSRNISSCGYRNEELKSVHTFNNIEIEAEVSDKDGQYLYMPTSLNTVITPLQPGKFEYKAVHTEHDRLRITMNLKKHLKDSITFGVYGRDFNLDDASVQ